MANLIKAKGKTRTDSTYILATIRNLNRLEYVGETLRAALNALAVAHQTNFIFDCAHNQLPTNT
jgi:hypothetical protein